MFNSPGTTSSPPPPPAPWRDHRSTCTTHTGMAVLLGSLRATSMDICACARARIATITGITGIARATSVDIFAERAARIAAVPQIAVAPKCTPTPNPLGHPLGMVASLASRELPAWAVSHTSPALPRACAHIPPPPPPRDCPVCAPITLLLLHRFSRPCSLRKALSAGYPEHFTVCQNTEFRRRYAPRRRTASWAATGSYCGCPRDQARRSRRDLA